MFELYDYCTDLKPLHKACYEFIRDEIVCGFVPVGQIISEAEYRHRLNVSRTPVRMALDKLEHQGIIQIDSETNRYQAVGLGADGIKNVYRLQASIERFLYPLVVSNATPEVITQFYRQIDKISLALDQNDLVSASDLGAHIHREIMLLSGFPGVDDVIDWAYGLVNGFNLMSLADQSRHRAIVAEHAALVRAIESNDLLLILETAATHTAACRTYSLQKYQENLNRCYTF